MVAKRKIGPKGAEDKQEARRPASGAKSEAIGPATNGGSPVPVKSLYVTDLDASVVNMAKARAGVEVAEGEAFAVYQRMIEDNLTEAEANATFDAAFARWKEGRSNKTLSEHEQAAFRTAEQYASSVRTAIRLREAGKVKDSPIKPSEYKRHKNEGVGAYRARLRERHAAALRHVGQTINRQGPGGKVRAALQEAGIDVGGLKISSKEGTATISGEVTKPELVAKIVEIAQKVEGINKVHSSVDVTKAPTQPPAPTLLSFIQQVEQQSDGEADAFVEAMADIERMMRRVPLNQLSEARDAVIATLTALIAEGAPVVTNGDAEAEQVEQAA